ncbi:UNVERIFIED_CONTAM: hypothetical protein Slati_2179800 [Sesamum latifolium]|uniref:Retrotransposon gag domain-containing protein n=1 Tax=Sesamum latifolium TaxID=2727402 RepID=A0AAW2WV18_9LAMI
MQLFYMGTRTGSNVAFLSVPSLELPSNVSISCLRERSEVSRSFDLFFLHQFVSSRKIRKTKYSLFFVRQKENEPLKEYLQKFNAAALEVPSVTQEVKASACSQGLLDGDFFKSLANKPVFKFDTLLARAGKYINLEDAQAVKKESHGEKKNKTKEEIPSKKPQTNFWDKKPPLPESERSIHSPDHTSHPSPYGYRRKRAYWLDPNHGRIVPSTPS